ncbi:hypothetical protein Pan2_48 [Pseudanabaena phage Pan2]|nr:hypothetical protein Pan2_48 [Pseudanabaena phage Pan2]
MSGYNLKTESILDYYLYGLYEIHDPSGSMPEDEYQACRELWTAQFFGWLEFERARIWDECVDAHEQVTNSGRQIDPLYMTRMNPYRAKEDA